MIHFELRVENILHLNKIKKLEEISPHWVDAEKIKTHLFWIQFQFSHQVKTEKKKIWIGNAIRIDQ